MTKPLSMEQASPSIVDPCLDGQVCSTPMTIPTIKFLEFPHCPICDSADTEVVFATNDEARRRFVVLSQRKYQGTMDSWAEGATLDVLRCQKCDHLWYLRQPDQDALFAMYRSSVSLNGASRPTEPSARMLGQMRAIYQLCLKEPGHKPRLLDYGSGYGLWARAAHLVGFDVTCYEPVASRSHESSHDNNLRVVNDLDALPEGAFEAVNIEQVLEHVPWPLEVLRNVRRCARRGALIRITVPNAKRHLKATSWEEFPFNGRDMHLMSPYEHLQGFSPKSLRTAVLRAGLKPAYAQLTTKPLYWLRLIYSGTAVLARVG